MANGTLTDHERIRLAQKIAEAAAGKFDPSHEFIMKRAQEQASNLVNLNKASIKQQLKNQKKKKNVILSTKQKLEQRNEEIKAQRELLNEKLRIGNNEEDKELEK